MDSTSKEVSSEELSESTQASGYRLEEKSEPSLKVGLFDLANKKQNNRSRKR